MKKTYISPDMKVAEMELEALICESLMLSNEGFQKDLENDLTTGSGLTKKDNLWDNIW